VASVTARGEGWPATAYLAHPYPAKVRPDPASLIAIQILLCVIPLSDRQILGRFRAKVPDNVCWWCVLWLLGGRRKRLHTGA
jgi:hypothetical protein